MEHPVRPHPRCAAGGLFHAKQRPFRHQHKHNTTAAVPPQSMVKRLSFALWTVAYATINESVGDPIKLIARLDPSFDVATGTVSASAVAGRIADPAGLE